MKAVKILFAVLAALWTVALVPKLLAGLSSESPYAFSYTMGSLAGMLVACTISLVLFRSARRG